MRNTVFNILLTLRLRDTCLRAIYFCLLYLLFFLLATVFTGPLRVRALFLVFDRELVIHDGDGYHGMMKFPLNV